VKALLKHTVWASDAIPLDEWKYRNLRRVVLPFMDALLILGAISAAGLGVPALNEFFPSVATPIFAYSLLLASITSIVGVIFPKQWRLEISGKVAILGLMVGYLCSLVILVLDGDGNRAFIFFIAMVTIVIVIWRLSILGSEWQLLRIEDPTNDQGKGD